MSTKLIVHQAEVGQEPTVAKTNPETVSIITVVGQTLKTDGLRGRPLNAVPTIHECLIKLGQLICHTYKNQGKRF